MTPDPSASAVALPASAVPAARARPDMRRLGFLALGHMVIGISAVMPLVAFLVALFLPEPKTGGLG